MEREPDLTKEMDTDEGIILIALVGVDDVTYQKVINGMQPRAGYGFLRLEDMGQVDTCSFGVPEVVLVPDNLMLTALPSCGAEILTITHELVTEKGDNRLSLADDPKMVIRGKEVSYFQDAIEIITETALSKRRKALLEKYAADFDAILNTEKGIDIDHLIELFAAKDSVALGHIKMVAKFAEVMAQGIEQSQEIINLTEQEKEDFKTIALVHDIGKLVTPDQLLKNDDAYSSKEYASMQQHVDISLSLAKNEKTQELLSLALKHHYRFDGYGYLVQSKEEVGENIPIIPRMMAIIDSFDAICDPGRKYQGNDPNDSLVAKAINIMYTNSQEKSALFPNGGQFDPKLAHAFLLGFKDRFNTDEKFRMEIIGRELHTDDPVKIDDRITKIGLDLETTIAKFGYQQDKTM